MPVLVALTLHDDAERWRSLGFSVGADGACQVGAVRLAIVPTPEGSRTGLTGWTFEGTAEVDVVDGIPTCVAPAGAPPPAGPPPAVEHPNGTTSLDHVVVTTPDLARTVAAFEAVGLSALRERPTDAGGRPMRQVFFRPGEAIVELVGPAEPTGDGRARFFGLAFTVADLDVTAASLGGSLGRTKEAVQPGRRIATVRSDAGLGVPVAFMSGEPGR